jgi:hypothetical protein
MIMLNNPSQEGMFVDTPYLLGVHVSTSKSHSTAKAIKIKKCRRLVIYQKLESLLRTSRDRYLEEKLLKTYSRYKLGMESGRNSSPYSENCNAAHGVASGYGNQNGKDIVVDRGTLAHWHIQDNQSWEHERGTSRKKEEHAGV